MTQRTHTRSGRAIVYVQHPDATAPPALAPVAPQLPPTMQAGYPVQPSTGTTGQFVVVQGQIAQPTLTQQGGVTLLTLPDGTAPVHVPAAPVRRRRLAPGCALVLAVLLVLLEVGTGLLFPASLTAQVAQALRGNVVPNVTDAGAESPLDAAVNAAADAAPAPVPAPLGDGTLERPPTVDAAFIDQVLASYGSPAEGMGQAFYDAGVARGIDPAWALAFFIHESSAGTNPAWAGWKPDGTTTHNVGNIICTSGFPSCYGRFRDYATWEAGIADWYRLIDDEYIQGRGTATVDAIIPIYAPSFENDVQGYIGAVQQLVDGWQQQQGSGATDLGCADDADQPCGNPLGTGGNVVLTQGYGVGSHAPAAVWGAIDLALDGNGDGTADPQATQGQPIYATHAGVATVSPGTYPAGNHVWVIGSSFKTGYSHLQDFTVADGQTVARGDQIGTLGSTGESSGPHLDYQVWQRTNDDGWTNVNPLDYLGS